ncbi:hypothetical protein [Colwellia sp. Arc7-635]|uniref:hypothetical protein n=1 Tax=Colwellia sp. Arc7-635 TaxID=2497879 RepID=UPI0013E0A438|nr:hypothetical protein [Colwellia sp. Arc7-635]
MPSTVDLVDYDGRPKYHPKAALHLFIYLFIYLFITKYLLINRHASKPRISVKK